MEYEKINSGTGLSCCCLAPECMEVANKIGVMVRFFSADHTAMSFPIRARSGDVIGFVDSIEPESGQITVTGWASADEVGLQNGGTRISKEPDLCRDDVIAAYPKLAPAAKLDRLGFRIIAPFFSADVFFFVRQGPDTYYFHL